MTFEEWFKKNEVNIPYMWVLGDTKDKFAKIFEDCWQAAQEEVIKALGGSGK